MPRETLLVRYYSLRTEQQYGNWLWRFLHFHYHRYPRVMGAAEVSGFLTHLIVDEQVSASMQNQALSALRSLYREVLILSLLWLNEVVRAKQSRHLPVVLTRQEVAALLAQADGLYALQLHLLYGTGMRLMECTCLRVKDIDFGRGQILVRDGKGAKDRVTMLPQILVAPLSAHLQRRRTIHEAGVQAGMADVYIYPMRWHGNSGMQGRNGAGNMCFSPLAMCAIRALVHNGGIIRMKSCCSER